MNVKSRRTKKVNVENQAINLLSKEELDKKIEVVEKELRSYTWRKLEANGKFAKNDKLSFITDDMLIVGCDIGSEMHYIRAIDVRGRELSRGAFEFSNTCNGVQREHNKKLNNGLPILHKVPPKRDYGRYFCIMAEKGGTSHGGLTEKLSLFFHAKKQEVNAYGR